jgi:hypothetical protein
VTAACCMALYLQQAAKQASYCVVRSRAEGNVRPVLTHGNKQPASQADVGTSTRPVCDICDVHGCSGVQACTGTHFGIATLLTVAASGGPSTLPAPQQLLPCQRTAVAVPAACATATAWRWLPCASAACEPKKGIAIDKQVCGVTHSEPLSLQTYPPDMPGSTPLLCFEVNAISTLCSDACCQGACGLTSWILEVSQVWLHMHSRHPHKYTPILLECLITLGAAVQQAPHPAVVFAHGVAPPACLNDQRCSTAVRLHPPPLPLRVGRQTP